MPRQSARSKNKGNDVTDGSILSKAQSKGPPAKSAGKGTKGKTPNVRSMPPPLPLGETMTDLNKKQWKLGSSIGKGGFGEIYTATLTSATKTKTCQYVIKVEPHENGPLFTELSFYLRSAKLESIDKWVSSHQLDYLGIPPFIGSGLHESSNKTNYRFMVMERFGDDIEKLFCKAGRIFTVKTVCYLALRLIEALEYLHESEYVHADIKGSNLLTGLTSDTKHQVYLVDYGLAYRYGPEEEHRDYKPDPRRCHDGTIEFTSIDAHNGANPSRRGDMEILGYCLLQWACGRLPWESHLEDKPKVAAIKTKYKSLPVADLMKACFKDEPIPPCLSLYMQKVYGLSYKEKPPYDDMKTLFLNELKDRKLKDNKEGLDWMESVTKGKKRMVLEINPVEVETDFQLSPPPIKRRKTVAKTKTQKEAIEEVPKIKESNKSPKKAPKRSKVSQKDTTKTKGEEIQESEDSTKTSKQKPMAVKEEKTMTAKILPRRACKTAAQARIKSNTATMMEKSFEETTDYASSNKEEREDSDREEEVKEIKHTRKTAGTKRKKSSQSNSDNILESKEEKEEKKVEKTTGTKRRLPSPSDSDTIFELEELKEEETKEEKMEKPTRREKSPPYDPDIISDLQEATEEIEENMVEKPTRTKRKKLPQQAQLSNIIPGLEKPKEETKVERPTGTKRRKPPPTGSEIIPGLEESKRNKTQDKEEDKTQGSVIIPGVAEEKTTNGHDVIIPKGHYPQELGYKKPKTLT